MNAEKESNPQKAAQKKDEKQAANSPFSLRETENANFQTQESVAQNEQTGTEKSSPQSENASIPAVHGSSPAYSDGSEQKYQQLQASMGTTGELDHPDTKQKEMEYRSTLGINELREYHDAKTADVKSEGTKPTDAKAADTKEEAIVNQKPTEAKPDVKPVTQVKKPEATPQSVGKKETTETAKAESSSEAVVGNETDENAAAKEVKADQQPTEAKEEIKPVAQPKKQEVSLQNALPNMEHNKGAKSEKPVKLAATSSPRDLLANLTNAPATELVSTYNAVQAQSATALNNQNKQAESKLPKLNAAEGSAFSNKPKTKNNPNAGKSGTKSSKKTVKPAASKKPRKETLFPTKEPLQKVNYSFQSGGNKNAPIDKQAKSQFDAIRLNTSGIPTRMQEKANLDLSGDASVEHVSIEQNDVSQDLINKKNHAAKDIHKDYGEQDIIKKPAKETLKAKHKFKSKSAKANPVKGFKTEGIDATIINANFGPIIHSKMGEEQSKYDAAQLEYDQNVLAEENAADGKIDIEKSKSKEKQSKSVREAQGDVTKSRAEWQRELNKTETDFEKKSGDHAKTTMGKIQTEKTSGEAKAQGHINKANEDANKKKLEADKEAAAKKEQEQKKSGGFLGWLSDKASAFINALKDALNYIFTKLREAVKAIFDLAKKLVLAALELARKVIVGFIKAFAAVLKGFLDVALAAFPEIRDRLKAKIDHYVTVAEKYVNQAFDMFKSAVTAIMDFLADMVDKLLGLVQSVFDGILTVAGMIARGEIGPLLEKLGHIKDALFGITFDTIKQGGMEELLGADLDESLSPQELMAAMQMGLISGGDGGDSDSGMPKAPWTNENVGVDVVSFEDLSPEMQAELKRMRQAGQTEAVLGERNDSSRTMDSVMEEAHAGQGQEASGEKFNDGLTPMKRAEIKWELMKTGIKQWWDQNWLKVVGGIIAALVVFIAAEVVTGGAITAAIPVIMPILADVFIGITVVTLAGYFADGLSYAWNGAIAKGTKAFSRGLGAALIELAMYLGFKLIEVAGKVVTQFVKSGMKMAKAGVKSVMEFGKFIIAKGKVLFKGVAGKNLGKLYKSLRKLADDILERMRIKRVLLKIQSALWKVQAEINPTFTIMSGPMPNEEMYDLIKKDKSEVPKGLKIGDEFIDAEGRRLRKVSDLDEFKETPDYRKIFQITFEKDITNDVIHHLVEKNSRYAKYFEKEFINAPKNLRAIPKGNVNSILHLSDIRIAWSKMYTKIDALVARGASPDQIREIIIKYAAKTDDFIEKSLVEIAKKEGQLGRVLTKEEVSEITSLFKNILN